MVQPDIHDKQSKLEMKKNSGCERIELIDCRLPLQDARFERGETNNQIWRLEHFTRHLLRISPPNIPNRITTIPSIRIPEQPLYVWCNAIRNQTLTKQGVPEEYDSVSNRYTQISRILNKHKIERDRTESNCNISGMRMESSQRNSQNETEEATTSPTRSIQFEKMDKDRNRYNTSLFLNITNHQKTYAARLRGWNTMMIMNKIVISDKNWWITKLGANIPAQLIQIPPQMTMTADAAPSGKDSTLEKELEMIAIAHGTWNKMQVKLSRKSREIKAITQGLRIFAKVIKNFASSIPINQKRQLYSSFLRQEMVSISIINNGNQTGTLNNRKAMNLDPNYSPPRSQKPEQLTHQVDYQVQEITNQRRRIHVNNKRTRKKSNRCSQSNMEEGTPMDSSSYRSLSSNSEEDQRRADRSNDISSTMARPDIVHRTGKQERTIPYAWLKQRDSGTRNIVDQEEFETPARDDMLFPDGPKARKGRRFVRKILRILNVSKGAINMILYGQRYNTQRRYYYKMENFKKWTQIIQYTILDLLSMKPYIIITEVLAQFTSVNTSASSALQFLNGLSLMLSLTFDNDLKNNHMLQFIRNAILAHMIVKPKYEDTWNVGKLFDYWRGKGSNRNPTNIELQTKLTLLLMTICSM
ncbi:MAG: hypothetical protein EZS28_010392 [Streblomastix strix]|uniref:Uncharacterized protein n=1 Tax=Streblomastix strix TaxID=222440 RepID=A0A5J4WGY3_9EUKA|nr:MAG: hypothetical protein EZS28_010392 [Streblomastix strix]